jgi:hypothetical protein
VRAPLSQRGKLLEAHLAERRLLLIVTTVQRSFRHVAGYRLRHGA